MRCRRLLLTLALLAGACAGSADDGNPRFTSAKQRFSIHELPGWAAGWDRGMQTFRSPGGDTVIAVRGVTFERGSQAPRTPDVVLPATERVLAGLPEARVAGPAEVSGASMRAWSFEVSYLPPEREQRVFRRHVVMFGDQRVFHVVITTSRDALDLVEGAAFQSVLASLREEA